jgi:UDP-glucuronate 4-epimerase
MQSKKILITGSAGFIGSELSLSLLNRGFSVVGIDNLNDYYDPNLKKARLARHINHKNYLHSYINITKKESIEKIFQEHDFDTVINLAAQAGVRYSIENPRSYIEANILGFLNIIESCRDNKIKHLIYASSSSVYGLNKEIPFSTESRTDHPISVYASTKKTNELLAHTYSYLFKLPTTGLRFFTVYGPWDRPDMALQTFTRSIIKKEPINLYNYGKHKRDFTYIDDIIKGLNLILDQPVTITKTSNHKLDQSPENTPYRIYNIGSNNMITLERYVELLEKEFGINAEKKLLPLQPGDVVDTYANIDDFMNDFGFKPNTSIEKGVREFAAWYKSYYII